MKVVLDDGDGDDSALAAIAAGLISGPEISSEALLGFARRFEARRLFESAAQAYAGVRITPSFPFFPSNFSGRRF